MFEKIGMCACNLYLQLWWLTLVQYDSTSQETARSLGILSPDIMDCHWKSNNLKIRWENKQSYTAVHLTQKTTHDEKKKNYKQNHIRTKAVTWDYNFSIILKHELSTRGFPLWQLEAGWLTGFHWHISAGWVSVLLTPRCCHREQSACAANISASLSGLAGTD